MKHWAVIDRMTRVDGKRHVIVSRHRTHTLAERAAAKRNGGGDNERYSVKPINEDKAGPWAYR